jgi:hypothetical protein
MSANIVTAKTETSATSRLNATPRPDRYRPQGKRKVKNESSPCHHLTSTLVSQPRHLTRGRLSPGTDGGRRLLAAKTAPHEIVCLRTGPGHHQPYSLEGGPLQDIFKTTTQSKNVWGVSRIFRDYVSAVTDVLHVSREAPSELLSGSPERSTPV